MLDPFGLGPMYESWGSTWLRYGKANFGWAFDQLVAGPVQDLAGIGLETVGAGLDVVGSTFGQPHLGEYFRDWGEEQYRLSTPAADAGWYDPNDRATQAASMAMVFVTRRPLRQTPRVLRNAPPGFSNGNLGTEAHANFESALNTLYDTRPRDWRMRTALGQKGVDATYIGPPSRSPGFIHAELKPYSQGSIGTLGNQLGPWNLPAGQTELFFYNQGGVIGSSGFRF